MTGSRRQRGRQEATFLEEVKGLLQDLKTELDVVKRAIVSEGGQFRPGLGAVSLPSEYSAEFDDWCAWYKLGFDEPADSTLVRFSTKDTLLRAEAAPYYPSAAADTYSREDLLDVRLRLLTCPVPGELKDLFVKSDSWDRDTDHCSEIEAKSSSDVCEHDIPCHRCGQPLDEPAPDGEYDGDRCDTCEKYLHSRCLSSFMNMCGEWSLCGECAMQFEAAAGIRSIRGDFRSLPATAWANIHSSFARKVPEVPPTTIVDVSSEASRGRRAEIAAVVQLRQTLECHLDHMVKYLELDHGSKLPAAFYDGVLKTVQDTLAWKQGQLSAAQIQNKIDELGNFMNASLKQHGLLQ